jgi:hypothetical protein
VIELKDVLITLDEENKLWEKVGAKCTNYKIWATEINKAQCLKLIEWLEETCTEHGPFGREGYGMRYFCPVCRAELKKQLEV